VATTAVNMSGSAFNPPAIQVAPGATVTYTNQDGIDHNVTFSSTAVTSTGNFSSGSKTVVMPGTPGTYAYHCTIHAGMAGTVVVQ
jgi:plastocyanin